MDTAEEARDYDAMDHSTVNRLFTADFLALWSGESPVLDLGTGTAQIPIEVCRADARPVIVGVDAAGAMLKLAADNVRSAGFDGRITLHQADAKRLPFADGHFAAVMSNSIVHHIPDPGRVLAEMARVCRPGGLVFVRDLMRPADEAELNRLVDLHAAGANDHQRQMFAESLHAALTLAEVRELVTALGLDAGAVTATSDRHWTWAARR